MPYDPNVGEKLGRSMPAMRGLERAGEAGQGMLNKADSLGQFLKSLQPFRGSAPGPKVPVGPYLKPFMEDMRLQKSQLPEPEYRAWLEQQRLKGQQLQGQQVPVGK